MATEPSLAAARDIEDFLRDPIDRYVERRTFCFWQIGTHTKGVIAWGHPTERDAREMVQSFEAGARVDEPHVSLVDMQGLDAVDVAAFDVVMHYMTARRPTFERTVLRQALVHGSGAIGAAVAGFYRVVAPAYPVESFRELAAAVSWLAPDRVERVLEVVTGLRERVLYATRVVTLLRTQLGASARIPNAAQAARAMGMSLRTLQRELTEANTTFRGETARFRLAEAERLLSGSSLSVKTVAQTLDITPGRLSELFRRAHGVGVEGWRSRVAPARRR